MDYFKRNPNFSILKNYILNDPLLDWFEINNDQYKRDDYSYYREYIIKEANNYKDELLKKIYKLSKLSIPLNTDFHTTKKLIEEKSPLILRGKLLDNNGYYVGCDIVIQYSLFKRIFPYIRNLPFHILCKEDDYLLINISYASLHFKMDLKDVINEGLILYKKCELYAFREIFNEWIRKKCQCFIISKEYYYKKTLLPKKEFICKVSIDENIKLIFNNALQWIIFLKENRNMMDIYPFPTHHELYPNMNYKESSWENEKLKLANEIKEITLVWNISYDKRCQLLNQNIKCWDDPKLLNELKETKKKNIQEQMIHMNQQNEILIHPRKTISKDFQIILNRTNNDIYFDIESFLSFDEKRNMDTIVNNPILAIIGYIYNEKFYDHTIQGFSKENERQIVKSFADQLHKISRNNVINIYHWGHAENRYFQYIKDNYTDILFPEYKLIDVLDYFRMEPIIVQGVFQFGLKSIGKALYKNKLIKTTWDEYDNGLDTMIHFKELCKYHNKNIPIKRYLEIKKIINYNRVDCQVLYEIVELLRNKYDH